MIMWEVLHDKVPFMGDVRKAIEYVVREGARPLILTQEDLIDDAASTHYKGSNPTMQAT